MKMLALRAIPSSVGLIEEGSTFTELDPYRVEDLIATKMATPYVEPPPPTAVPGIALDWTGGTAVIVCSGESLTVEQCDSVKAWRVAASKRYVIAVNTSFRRAPFADVLYGCDWRWWKAKEKDVTYFEEALQTFRKDQMWVLEPRAAKELGINSVKSAKREGLSKLRDTINEGGNSGYQAIGLAVLAGVKKIIIIGMDMRGGHWHGDHPSGINARLPFSVWLKNFGPLAADLKAAQIEVVNSTPNSSLKVFPYVELKEALCLPSATSGRIRLTAVKRLSPDSAGPVTP